MPEQLRVEAVACAEKLKPFGKTISEATEHFLAHLSAMTRTCLVSELIAEFKATKAQDGASKRYLQDLRNRLATFSEDFGELKVSAVQPSQIDDCERVPKTGPGGVLVFGLV